MTAGPSLSRKKSMESSAYYDLFEILALLIVGHMLADYPLQGDFLARAKSRTNAIPGVPWQHAMLAHSVIHGGFVGMITGSVLLGLAETVVHFWIDDWKCSGGLTYHQDQLLHGLCKVAWVTVLALTGAVTW